MERGRQAGGGEMARDGQTRLVWGRVEVWSGGVRGGRTTAQVESRSKKKERKGTLPGGLHPHLLRSVSFTLQLCA